MNDNQLDDLKQFIEATVSQSEQRVKDELKDEIKIARQESADGFAGVGEAIESIHNQLDDTEARVVKLEQKTA